MTGDFPVLRRLSGSNSPGMYQQIATLHSDLIHGGVLPLLGKDFLICLYREIAKSKWGSMHTAEQNGRVIGFIAGTADVWHCALGFTLFGYLRLTSILALRIWHPQIMRKVIDSLAYPFRKPSIPGPNLAPQSKHRAELLAIAVSPAAQGTGVGRALVRKFEETLRGTTASYFVATNASEGPSNAFYDALGFQRAGQKRHHDLLIQIYTKQVGETMESPLT